MWSRKNILNVEKKKKEKKRRTKSKFGKLGLLLFIYYVILFKLYTRLSRIEDLSEPHPFPISVGYQMINTHNVFQPMKLASYDCSRLWSLVRR